MTALNSPVFRKKLGCLPIREKKDDTDTSLFFFHLAQAFGEASGFEI